MPNPSHVYVDTSALHISDEENLSEEMNEIQGEMKAVVFNGPFSVSTIEVPTPRIENPTDVIVKVKYSGVCGTDLHTYRGHINLPKGQVIGHEFVGRIVSKGSEIPDSSFKVGDDVLSTFTVQCGKCWYCRHGYSGQCRETNTFGKVGLDGGQAEYVRVPYALSTLIKKPVTSGNFDDSVYVLMADIFITGYFGVKKIINFLKTEPTFDPTNPDFSGVKVLQLGAGPVGLCAIRVFKYFGFNNVVCVDSIPSRLKEAQAMGAKKVINFQLDKDGVLKSVDEVTDGVGYDAILEVVGAQSALRSAYTSVRGNGFISSIGMPYESLPFTGLECYLKNVNISFGRCHARSLFPEALEIFEKVKADFVHFIDCKLPIEDSEEAYKIFDAHKVGKVIFDLTK